MVIRHRPRLAPTVFLLVVAASVASPWIAPHGSAETVAPPYRPPGEGFLLGTDHLGRDVWSKLLHGGRSVIVLPLLATATAALLGAALGVLTAGHGVLDRALRSALDVVVVIPPVLVLLVLLYNLDDRAAALLIAIIVISVPYVSRLTRAVATPILGSGFVEQAVALGDGRVVVALREVVPNLIRPLLADAGARFVGAVYLTAAAGFLGFGAGADWGTLIADNIDGARLNPWGVVAPCLALGLLTVSVNRTIDTAGRGR